MSEDKTYLSNFIYADYNGFSVVIAEEDDRGEIKERIFLRPEECAKFIMFIKKLYEGIEGEE